MKNTRRPTISTTAAIPAILTPTTCAVVRLGDLLSAAELEALAAAVNELCEVVVVGLPAVFAKVAVVLLCVLEPEDLGVVTAAIEVTPVVTPCVTNAVAAVLVGLITVRTL